MTPYELITIAVALVGVFITTLINLVCFFYKMGRFEEKLQNLEKKQEKHNNVIERMARAEDKLDSAHHRIDDFSDQFAILNEKVDDFKDILIDKLR